MVLKPSLKVRWIAALSAIGAFCGTLVVVAHASAEETRTRTYVIIATRDDCIDYNVGDRITVQVNAATAEEVIQVNLGGTNDGIWAVAADGEPVS